jgi:hypothetical protein
VHHHARPVSALKLLSHLSSPFPFSFFLSLFLSFFLSFFLSLSLSFFLSFFPFLIKKKLFVEKRFHSVVLAGLDLAIQNRTGSDTQLNTCLCLPSIGANSICPHSICPHAWLLFAFFKRASFESIRRKGRSAAHSRL